MSKTETTQARARPQGRQLHFRARGKGAPVLLVHGLGADSRIWDLFDLPGHRLIAVDLPGCGGSRLDASLTTALHHAELLEAFMREHAEGPFAVMGHSFGGLVALELAAAFPERVRAAVLISVPARMPSVAKLYGAPLVGEAVAHVSSKLPVSRAAIRAYLTFVFGGRRAVTEQAVDAYAKIVATPDYHHGMLGGLRALLRWKPTARLQRLKAPTALVWGERDRLLPIAIGRELARLLPHARFHALRHCGHCPQEEAPGELAAIAAALFESAAAAGDPADQRTSRTDANAAKPGARYPIASS